MKPDYYKLPLGARDSMKQYIEVGQPPGAFMRAVLSNDLVGAFMYCDDINRYAMWEYANFLYNELPARSHPNSPWGSEEKVNAWIDRGGVAGGALHHPIARMKE